MEASEEIRRVIERWTQASARGGDEPLARLSEHPGTLMIGTDPAEWWRGRAAQTIWARQIREIGPFPVTATEIEAWEEGTVGWAAVKESIAWEGRTLLSRATYVLHLERDEWKVVQVHWSFPQTNTEAFGKSLTVSLDELEETLRREQPDISASRAVDGTVTIVFTDIVDSTPTLARLGDAAWLDVVQRHHQLIADAAVAHDGAVVDTQGDGAMLAFQSARRALACALAIQHQVGAAFADHSPPIRVRIGVHTGDAIKGAERFYGTTVHYAARVASQAIGGEVLASSAVHELVRSGADFTFHPGREVELKGIPGRHLVYALAHG
jgi:class 3 adenylate cyclase